MSTVAPQAIWDCWDAIHAGIPSAQLSGIVGDPAHTYGYHLSRQDCSGGDYSVQLSRDQPGPGNIAAALDVTLSADLMKTCTNRLLKAAKAKDPRMKAVRSFCGTTNGTVTHSYDCSNGHEGYGEWDDSHLWHIHISFYRDSANNSQATVPVADVVTGSSTSGGGQTGDDMPQHVSLNRSTPAKLKGGQQYDLQWDVENTDPGNVFTGSKDNPVARLNLDNAYYVSTFTGTIKNAPNGTRVHTCVVFCDLAGNNTGQSPWHEHPVGDQPFDFVDTRSYKAGADRGIKVRIKSPKDVTVDGLQWRVHYWK